MGDPVRTGRGAGFAALIAMAVYLPTQTRAQSGPDDIEETLVIPVHPSTPTTVQVREAIVDAWIRHDGEFLMEIVGQNINLRPHPDTLVGTEAVLVVETSTARRRFRLRVVERREDAIRKLDLPAVKPVKHEERTGAARHEVSPVAPAEPQPPESTPESTPAPQTAAALQPQTANEPTPELARESAESAPEHGDMVTAARAFDLSAHAVVSLGITALDVPGYEPDNARQLHGGLGLRLTVAPHDKSWALEASVSGERLTGSMTYIGESRQDLAVHGTWLRAEMGMRTWVGTRWVPTAYAGLGLQAHLQTKEATEAREQPSFETMEPGVALVVGLGLQYRAGDVLLGVEFQGRSGEPNDYFSIAALWTVGRYLDQGD